MLCGVVVCVVCVWCDGCGRPAGDVPRAGEDRQTWDEHGFCSFGRGADRGLLFVGVGFGLDFILHGLLYFANCRFRRTCLDLFWVTGLPVSLFGYWLDDSDNNRERR